ncbi:Mce family protein [Gordonia hirsuta DSM 44140 = NBRC 16056]|uniref:Mce family protein n=1 Tax=Gordonia hirsuta DSM 44140 = NBRC 16056 TaxID=1121927 RepID=L7L5Y6_9ACTN|nr:MCE family protein [Gordonia hirsuta]GAC56354.1 Mce family protein [Gordonia hirsuta DSM 44140 = NBRC 16056]
MTRRSWGALLLAVIVAVAAVVSFLLVPRVTTYRLTVIFPSAVGLYAGDDVRVLGIPVGHVVSVTPEPSQARVVLSVDRSQQIPDSAQAVVLTQSLVSGRFVQLTPPFTGGPALADGATIPRERTAVPVEWNQLAEQLLRVSQDLSPALDEARGPLGSAVGSLAANLDGQGASLRQTVTSLSQALSTVSQGRHDLYGMVANLQVFVSALADSDAQIVSFNNRMMSVTGILDANRDDLGAALSSLEATLGQVTGFIQENRDGMTTALRQLGEVTQTLATHRDDLAQVLHVAPTALANLNNIYQPAHNSVVSALAMSNFANPVQFVCSSIAAAEQTTAQRGAELCVKHLGPLLRLLTMDYPPIATNPTRGVGALPDQLVYSGVKPPAQQAPAQRKTVAEMLVPGVR